VNPEKIKKDFPILGRKIGGRKLIYLDSASTSQKPRQVIEAVSDFYKNRNSNIHRAVYKLSEESTEMYESARDRVARFIGARDHHIIFTKNCTEAINLVAQGWARKNIKRGDFVLSSVMEHHSNIVPWQRLRDVSLKFLDVDRDGNLIHEKISKNTSLVSITHASNVLGTVNDIRKLAKESHDNGSLFMLDAAQSAPHMKLDIDKLDCDFVVFSGHKMLGPMGIGILAVRKSIAEDMEPLMFGSDMIREVTLRKTTFADAPMKFETGTPNVAGAVGLTAAIDYLEKIGMDKIEKHGKKISDYVASSLAEIEELTIYGCARIKSPVFSFNLKGVHSHDVATILDKEGIAVRSGHHCAQPLMKKFGVGSMVRSSFYIYNTKSDVDALVSGLRNVMGVLKT
jgi:cysteine desulfurase/selenocysteine lyase